MVILIVMNNILTFNPCEVNEGYELCVTQTISDVEVHQI